MYAMKHALEKIRNENAEKTKAMREAHVALAEKIKSIIGMSVTNIDQSIDKIVITFSNGVNITVEGDVKLS